MSEQGYSATGNLGLNVHNITSSYALSGAYFPCALTNDDVIWNISATQIGDLKIYDVIISNATLKLVGRLSNTTDNNVVETDTNTNTTGSTNNTVWSGVVTGTIAYPPFTSSVSVDFSTSDGVSLLKAKLGL